jgi:hypothetical protein
MVKTIKNAANYVNVGLVPNVLASLCLYDLYDIVNDMGEGDIGGMIGIGMMGLLNLGLGLWKFADYKKVKGLLEEKGWDDRIVRPKSYSWCDRYATKQAAKQTGHQEEYRNFNENEGHKWYHLLPKVHRFHEVF